MSWMIKYRNRSSKLLARFPWLMALLGGMLMALGPAPLNLWIVAWVAIVPLWWLAIEDRSPVKSGIIWGIAYHGISLFWITGLHPLMWMDPAHITYLHSVTIVAVIWGFITLFGAVCVGLWAGALAWMTKRRIHPIIRVLSAAGLWCAIEQLRSYSALDWTGIAYTQSPGNLAILHLGQLSGNALIAAAIVAVNGAIAESWQSDKRSGTPKLTTRVINRLTSLLPAIGLFTMAHLIGWGISLAPSPNQSNLIRIGTVQGNIGTRTQFSEAGVRQGFKNYSDGYETLVTRGAQMVLFPEGSFPMRWADYPNNPMAQKIQALKVPVALGASGVRADRRMTQAMLMVDDRGKIMSQYDKVKVVPLGEALPFEDVLGNFIRRLFPIQDSLVPGQPDQIFKTPFGQAAIGICYESAFPEIFRHQVQQGATFLITASNLDPYGTVLMAQQEAHDTMRAIETDRPIIRVTNTGYSGLIESTGQIKWRSQPNRYDLHISEVYPRTTQTFYVRYGNWITPLLLGLSMILSLSTIGLTRQR